MLTQNELEKILYDIRIFREKNQPKRYKDYLVYLGNKNIANCNQTLVDIKTINLFVDYTSYSEEQLSFLKKINAYNSLGFAANDVIKEVLSNNTINHNQIVAEFNALSSNLYNLFDNFDFLEKSLPFINGINPKEEINYISSETGALSIHFQNQCNITGLEELSIQSKTWNNLIRQLHLLNGQTPDSSIQFQEITKGSLIVTLGISIYILKNLGQLIKWILEQKKSWLEIKNLEKQLENLNLPVDLQKQISEHINTQIEVQEDKMVDSILQKLSEQGPILNQDLLNGSPEKTLKEILKPLIEFLDKGGELIIRTSRTTDEEQEVEKIFYNVNSQLKRLNGSTPNEEQDLLDD